MPLSAALRQAVIQQNSETLERALPTNSNIWNNKKFTAVLQVEKIRSNHR